jgi:hypothetical protein
VAPAAAGAGGVKRGQDKETRNGNGGDGIDYEDPDPTEDFPQWSKTIILLLDYAMIEGIRRGMHMFVHLLDSARVELQAQVAQSAAEIDRQEKESKAASERRRRSVS